MSFKHAAQLIYKSGKNVANPYCIPNSLMINNHEVGGSIPPLATNGNKAFRNEGLYYFVSVNTK